jgi:hypothetical protein
MPSELHPFLEEHVIKSFGCGSPLDRGRAFEDPFMYAIYARYLLAYWITNNAWTPFAVVFEGALRTDQLLHVQDLEVNLSRGVFKDSTKTYATAVPQAVTHVGGSGHHDAYIWCRKRTVPEAEQPMALQLRHGKHKTRAQLLPQLQQSNSSQETMPFPLLSVNQKECPMLKGYEHSIVMIHADAMASVSWLWMIATTAQAEEAE